MTAAQKHEQQSLNFRAAENFKLIAASTFQQRARADLCVECLRCFPTSAWSLLLALVALPSKEML